MVKRLIALTLIILTLFPLVACTGNKGNLQTDVPSTDTTDIFSPNNPQLDFGGPKVTIKNDCVYLMVGDSYQLGYTIDDSIAKTDTIVWNSSNDSVSIIDGLITAKKEGYSYVSANGGNECLICIIPKNMAKLTIDTNNTPINSKDVYTNCKVSMNTDNPDFCFTDATAGIRIRGNSTAGYAKKPFRIKFNSKRNLLGMNSGAECKSWVLLAEWLDDSFLRNTMALSMASMMLGEYHSDWRYVSVTINGSFEGVYVLAEQSQINENRIDIEEAGAQSNSLMSGYLYELDSSGPFVEGYHFKIYYDNLGIYDLEDKEFKWTCNDFGKRSLYMTIKNENISNDQFLFSKYYMRGVFYILYQAVYYGKAFEFEHNFLEDPNKAEDYLEACKPDNAIKLVKSDKTPQEAVEAVIDVDSLARMYLFSELICNNDDLKKSFYMWVDFTEDGNGKLTFGCPWDHDGAIVAWNSYDYRETDEYFAAKRNLWYVMPMCAPWFVEEVKAQWQEMYENNDGFIMATNLIPNIVNNYSTNFSQEVGRWESHRVNDQKEHSEITKQWLIDRIAWLNTQFGKPTEE